MSYVRGSLQNVTIVKEGEKHEGFIFSLLNPPVPLGGNIISLDVFVDEFPMPKKSIFVATSEDVVNAGILTESRPIPFKPFQSARFLVIREGGLDPKKKHKIVIMSKMDGFEQIIIPFTFADRVGNGNGKVIVSGPAAEPEVAGEDATIFKNFSTPLVLSGKKAYVVCSSNGALSAKWTWMGVAYDNGGLYVPPVRAFGRIIVEISMDDGVRKRLPNFAVSSRHANGVLYTRHELAGLEVKRKLLVPFENRGFIMALELGLPNGFDRLAGRRKKPSKHSIRIHFLVDGNITSYGLAAVSQSINSRFNAKYSCLQISTAASRNIGAEYFGTIGVAPKSLKPRKVLTDSFDNDLELSYDVEIKTGETVKLALVGTGSFSSKDNCLKEYLYMRDNYARLAEETENGFKQFSSSTLSIRPSGQKQSQSVSKLVNAYEKAKACMRYLKTEYDGLGEGICAGLPRFPNYWARDTGWTLRGYLAIGDYRFAAATIDNFLRRQAKTSGRGATKGELPMIISGRAFLHTTTYGSADSTFLFPWAVRQYVLATGDVAFLQKRWRSIVDLVDWGLHKDIDGDGLVENGFSGVAGKLPIQDSTWMDHIDRRKSANDIQALFYESLVIGSELAAIAGDTENKEKWSGRAKELQDKIDREYWNPEAGFYYDTIRKDGSKDQSIRPNALVLLLTGAVKDRSKAELVLRRVEEHDMTTAWGVRTLSSQDPKYNPALYHDGAVWPLVTGWAAASEIKLGRKEQGLRYIESMADRILAENGMFAETYRGDRPEPFNSCILQAWSVGMYAYALREMMLGMKLNMIENKIQFEPGIPESLKDASGPMDFEHLVRTKKGSARMQVTVDPHNEKMAVTYRGAGRPEIFSSSYPMSVTYL